MKTGLAIALLATWFSYLAWAGFTATSKTIERSQSYYAQFCIDNPTHKRCYHENND